MGKRLLEKLLIATSFIVLVGVLIDLAGFWQALATLVLVIGVILMLLAVIARENVGTVYDFHEHLKEV